MSNFSPEIWYLVFQQLDLREDMRNLCAVSKSIYILATPFLYRSVVLGPSKATNRSNWDIFPNDVPPSVEKEKPCCGFLYRLLDSRKENLRAFVRDVTLERNFNMSDRDRINEKLQQPDNVIVKLVKKLPNLENVFLHDDYPLPDEFIHAMCDHSKSPKLHLLGERGKTQVKTQMTCVHTVHTSVPTQTLKERDRSIDSVPRPEIALHELFARCPNLQDLSVEISGFRRGCCRPHPSEIVFTRIEPLELGEDQTFPPLQKLSLSGYLPTEVEFKSWQNGYLWSQLKSLSLGPERTHEFLRPITGHMQSLLAFEITAYSDPDLDDDTCHELEDFLLSFGSLERLNIRGYFTSIAAIAHHPNLKHLTLHTIEEPTRERPTLEAKDISLLDDHCSNLENLEIDIRRNRKWPKGPITALANGFRNLRCLRLHVGLEIRRTCRQFFDEPGTTTPNERLEPDNDCDCNVEQNAILTHSTAKDLGQLFFYHRSLSSRLRMVLLNTGETLRRFPQWTPSYAEVEQRFTRTFEVRSPRNESHELVVTELEGKYSL